MSCIPAQPRIASAAVVLFGHHGDITQHAHQRGVHRQTLYREANAVVAAVDGSQTQQRLTQLQASLDQQQARADALQAQLAQAVVLDADKQAHFAATAQALGVSFSAIHALLEVLLPGQAPSIPQLGRMAQQAGRQAAALLAVLDEHSRARACQVAADEIFAGRKPVLMTLEQDSMCWLGGRLAPSRDGPEWAHEFRQLAAAKQVTRDGGQGLRKGLELVNDERRQHGQLPIADQEDHFHLLHWARRGMRAVQHQASRALRQAERAQQAFQGVRRRGQAVGGRGRAAHDRWQQAERAFDRWAAQERAYLRLREGLRLFTPQGELNTRAHAEAEVRAALAELTGPEWSRARQRLAEPEAFTFLDRVHEQLAALPVEAAVRERLVRVEGLRRQPELWQEPGPQAAAWRGLMLVTATLVARLGEVGAQAQQTVRRVLREAWRSSSLVEGLNSVVRMQQRRHKRLTQGLLDLKRLHWNVHVFRAGKRKGQSPYQRLGLVLPEVGWWQLLQMSPGQLRQELSALSPAA